MLAKSAGGKKEKRRGKDKVERVDIARPVL